MNDSANIESLQRNFPADFPVPSLLIEFGRWLKSKPAGSLGCFRLQSERSDDFWIENGADMVGHSQKGLWLSSAIGAS